MKHISSILGGGAIGSLVSIYGIDHDWTLGRCLIVTLLAVMVFVSGREGRRQ